jgi:hypothetical protein
MLGMAEIDSKNAQTVLIRGWSESLLSLLLDDDEEEPSSAMNPHVYIKRVERRGNKNGLRSLLSLKFDL